MVRRAHEVRRLRAHVVLAVLLAGITWACGGVDSEETEDVSPASSPTASTEEATAAADTIPVVESMFQTPRDTLDNIDSPAVWHGRAEEHWLIATAKETDLLVVSDAATGEELRRVGGEGTAPGRMDRPNGVAVAGDLLFLVERDNARVQVFRLPGFESLGTYGEDELIRPYGIALHEDPNGGFRTWVTDNYEESEDVVPPDSLLGERVREYHVTVEDGTLAAREVRAFGATSGEGVLRVVESIAVDPAAGTLLVAEEQEGDSMIKEYSVEGEFTGRIIGSEYFPHQAEGILLYACGDESGYWITTDQGEDVNTFHVFERSSLLPLGSFRGAAVLNTDGIALTQRPFPGWPSGAFYAVHNDGNVAAFHWSHIADRLSLRSDCTT